MKVLSISPAQSVYSKRNQQTNVVKQKITAQNQPAFRGDTGAAFGIIGGMALGALTAAVIVASGGLAAPVASIGLAGVMGTGAACGTHAGGIIGHYIEEKLDEKGS